MTKYCDVSILTNAKLTTHQPAGTAGTAGTLHYILVRMLLIQFNVLTQLSIFHI